MSTPGREYYDFEKGNPGVAIIFNHRYIEGERERIGTEKDRNRLAKILIYYGFKVRCYNDPTVTEIHTILEKVSKENHDKNNCLLIFVMTHGSQTQLCAKNRKYSIETLFTPFYDDQCPKLSNKPKFIFIQACRGRSIELGVIKGEKPPGRRDASDTGDLIYSAPSKADFLVMYSSLPGYISIREKTGSWFIQTICDELEQGINGIEVRHMVTTVCQTVATKFECKQTTKTGAKQMPISCSTLTKLCVLKAKPSPFRKFWYIKFQIETIIGSDMIIVLVILCVILLGFLLLLYQ